MKKTKQLAEMERADIQTLMKFVGIYCRQSHGREKTPFSFRLFDINEIEKEETLLCEGCTKFLAYGLTMRLKCPHNPKPMCKKCETQCYHGEY